MRHLLLISLSWNLFTPVFAAPTSPCDPRLLNHAFVRVIEDLVQAGQLNAAQVERLIASPVPYNPMIGQTMRATDESYVTAIERMLKKQVNPISWPGLRIALKTMLDNKRQKDLEMDHQRTATRKIFAPSVHSSFLLSHEHSQVATFKTHEGRVFFAFENHEQKLEVRELGSPEYVYLPPASLRPFGPGHPHSTISFSEDSEGTVRLHLHDLFPNSYILWRRSMPLDDTRIDQMQAEKTRVDGAARIVSADVLPDGRHSLLFSTAMSLAEFRAICDGNTCIKTPEEVSDATLVAHNGQWWGLHIGDRRSSLRVLEGGVWKLRGMPMAAKDNLDTEAQILVGADGIMHITIPRKDAVMLYEPLAANPAPAIVIGPPGARVLATQMFETPDHRLLMAVISCSATNQGHLDVYAPHESQKPVFSREIHWRQFGMKLDFFTGGNLEEIYLSVRAGYSPQIFEPLAGVILYESTSMSSSLISQVWLQHQGQTYIFASENGVLRIWQLFQGI